MNKKIKQPHTDELRSVWCGKDLETASESSSICSFRLPPSVLKNIYAMTLPLSLAIAAVHFLSTIWILRVIRITWLQPCRYSSADRRSVLTSDLLESGTWTRNQSRRCRPDAPRPAWTEASFLFWRVSVWNNKKSSQSGHIVDDGCWSRHLFCTSYVPVYGGEETMPLDLLCTISTRSCISDKQKKMV